MSTRTVLTYGTFDLFHIGHVRLLRRLASLGDRVIVGVSTDEFNEAKGKRTVISHADRAEIVSNIVGVTMVVPEVAWDQKRRDIRDYGVDVLAMGDDWTGKFDDLSDMCEVVYLPRTIGISSTNLKAMLRALDPDHLREMQEALGTMASILSHYRGLE
jgi:glycerol-3-phosphate cytidylyltransferase